MTSEIVLLMHIIYVCITSFALKNALLIAPMHQYFIPYVYGAEIIIIFFFRFKREKKFAHFARGSECRGQNEFRNGDEENFFEFLNRNPHTSIRSVID